MPTTAPLDSPERAAEVISLPLANTTTIYAGNLVAIDSTGKGVPAADTAGLRCAGRCQQDVVAGVEIFTGLAAVRVRRGCFRYNNSSIHPLVAANLGQMCYVETCDTVAASSTNSIKAGVVINIDSTGVYVDTRNAITG